MMNRIVIDARESGTTTGRYMDKLIEYLQKIDSENEYFVLYKSHRFGTGLITSSNFHEVKCDIKEFTFAEQTKLKRQIKKLRPDLVHFPIVQQPVTYMRPVVTSMLDLTTLRFKNPSKNSVIFKIKQTVYRFVNWTAAKKSRHIITISDFVKDEVIQTFHVPESKITTTYCAADKITDKPEPVNSLIGEQFIMYVGRPQPHKNLGRLIDAFKILRETRPDLKLVLAGKKDVLFLQHEKRVGELDLSDSVIFTDFISDGQLRWLYENCQAYVFPSLSEGFGLPGLEAMIHGAPVISSNATCLPEVYGNAAYYFNPLDEEEMAEVISHVLDDKDLRKSLIKKGLEQAKKYSWQRMAEQTLSVYKKTLG